MRRRPKALMVVWIGVCVTTSTLAVGAKKIRGQGGASGFIDDEISRGTQSRRGPRKDTKTLPRAKAAIAKELSGLDVRVGQALWLGEDRRLLMVLVGGRTKGEEVAPSSKGSKGASRRRGKKKKGGAAKTGGPSELRFIGAALVYLGLTPPLDRAFVRARKFNLPNEAVAGIGRIDLGFQQTFKQTPDGVF